MVWLNSISLELRTGVVFVLGVLLAQQINRAIYAWAYFKRPIGPWARPHSDAPPRSGIDYLPIVGWLGLRRENALHGPWHWLRPMLIELLWPAALAWLYWGTMRREFFPAVAPLPPGDPTLHLQFLAHATLFSLLMIATFIDFDEQTVPDQVTVPGALVALLFAALAPSSMLQMTSLLVAAPKQFTLVQVISPKAWPTSMDGPLGLLLAIGCFLAWCYSVLPLLFALPWGLRRWRFTKAAAVFWALSARDRHSRWIFSMAIVGSLAIAAAWFAGSGTERWQSLFTALVGLFFGGALMWSVRIVCSWAMQQEAMGFGDVMLLAMIGAFLGWQATLITFLLAPAAALAIAIPQRLFTGRNDIAFGPYLSLGAAAVVIGWPYWWETRNFRDLLFNLGWSVPLIVGGCVALMGLMLWGLRMWRELG